MTNSNYYSDQIDEFIEPVDIHDCEVSEEYCPRCLRFKNKVLMYFYPQSSSGNDYIVVLVCPECWHTEEE